MGVGMIVIFGWQQVVEERQVLLNVGESEKNNKGSSTYFLPRQARGNVYLASSKTLWISDWGKKNYMMSVRCCY